MTTQENLGHILQPQEEEGVRKHQNHLVALKQQHIYSASLIVLTLEELKKIPPKNKPPQGGAATELNRQNRFSFSSAIMSEGVSEEGLNRHTTDDGMEISGEEHQSSRLRFYFLPSAENPRIHSKAGFQDSNAPARGHALTWKRSSLGLFPNQPNQEPARWCDQGRSFRFR